MNIDELQKELKDLKRLIGKKDIALRILKAKLPDLQKKYEANPTVLNESEIVMANADKVNLETELYFLIQRKNLLERQIEDYKKREGGQPGGPQ